MEVAGNHKEVTVLYLKEKSLKSTRFPNIGEPPYFIEVLNELVPQKVDRTKCRVSFIDGLSASGCQFPCVVMIIDQSVRDAHEVELIMSRATLYLYVIVNASMDKYPSNFRQIFLAEEERRERNIFDFFSSVAVKGK